MKVNWKAFYRALSVNLVPEIKKLQPLLGGLGEKTSAKSIDSTLRTAVLNYSKIGKAMKWYDTSSREYGEAMGEVFKDCFFFPPGPLILYRATNLKEPLKRGEAFRLQTTLSHPFQSWSTSLNGAKDFLNEKSYLLAAKIPSKLMIVSFKHWQIIKNFLLDSNHLDEVVKILIEKSFSREYLESIYAKEVPDLPHRGTPYQKALRSKGKNTELFLHSIVYDILEYLIDRSLDHESEKEVVVNFSSKFKPLCEVVRAPK